MIQHKFQAIAIRKIVCTFSPKKKPKKPFSGFNSAKDSKISFRQFLIITRKLVKKKLRHQHEAEKAYFLFFGVTIESIYKNRTAIIHGNVRLKKRRLHFFLRVIFWLPNEQKKVNNNFRIFDVQRKMQINFSFVSRFHQISNFVWFVFFSLNISLSLSIAIGGFEWVCFY